MKDDINIDLLNEVANLTGLTFPGGAALLETLSAYINQLINEDFSKLINLLYRVDVNEDKLKMLLKNSVNEDAGSIIANLILERQASKIRNRRENNKRGFAEPEF